MPAYGMRSHVGFVLENSLDTLGGARTDFIEALSESVQLTIERLEVANVYGGVHERPDVAGLRRVEGDIVFAANADTLGFAIAGALGVSSTTEVTSGVLYNHTFTARTNDLEARRSHPTHSVEIFRDVTSAMIYTGCAWSKVSMNIVPNQALQVTLGVVGISAAVGSASTPTYPSSPVNPFTFDACSVQVGGAAAQLYEALTIDWDNQLEAIATINASSVPSRIKRGGPYLGRVSGTLAFENLTDYNSFANQTEQRMVIHFTRAGSFAFNIDIPSFAYTSFPVNAGGKERLTVGFEGQARYNSGSASTMRFQLWNTLSGYLI